MVIAAAAEGFLQTHDAALGEEKKCKSALKATPAFSLCWALLKLKQTPEILQREVGEKERKKRQPAGGGKTKGKVSESKERERTGEGKHRQAGRGGGERLSAGAPIDPVSFLSYIKRTPSWVAAMPDLPLPRRGEGGVAVALSSCVQLHAQQGVRYCMLVADQQGKKHLVYFYTSDLCEGGSRKCLESHLFPVEPRL